MITIPGNKMATRVASSLLRAADLEELVCNDLNEYEELAVKLAVDDDLYMDIRRKLEVKRESLPLFDTRRWVKNLEEAYRLMWQRHEDGLPLDHIEVPDVVGQPTAP